MPGELTKLVRTGAEKAFVAFTEQVGSLGFARTRRTIWVRLHEHAADVLHLHRSGISYGAPINASVRFRVHLAIRVLNNPFPGIGLNGPRSDTEGLEHRFHLRFNAESMHMFDRCVTDLVRFVQTIGEPWFAAFRAPASLLDRGDSPLRDEEKTRLRDALAGKSSDDDVRATRHELGVEKRRSRRPSPR